MKYLLLVFSEAVLAVVFSLCTYHLFEQIYFVFFLTVLLVLHICLNALIVRSKNGVKRDLQKIASTSVYTLPIPIAFTILTAVFIIG